MPSSSDEARARAEANFRKKDEQGGEREKVWAEHAATGQASDANRARLKALRLSKEAADRAGQNEQSGPPQKLKTTLKPGKKGEPRKDDKTGEPGQ